MRKDLLLVGLLVIVLSLMVIPLPASLIDVLLTFSIAMSVLLLMATIYVRQTYEFSTLPAVILIATIFRLALSIATTRSILSEAEAGDIIATFGDFVVAGSIAIGLVIFLIITVVQFLVVTKGAERVAEVGARFALDALPGKQMSIDADIRAGTIDQEEGARLRALLDRESRFFGAMDGAMKFVKGDAVAGLVIIAINLVGGIAVGMSLHGYSFSESASVFSLLTIGDGLVAQLPALIISLAAGILVTRIDSGENGDLGTRITDQLVADPRVLGAAAIIVLGLGLVPGLPFWVFTAASVILGISSLVMRNVIRDKASIIQAQAEEPVEEIESQPMPPRNNWFVLRLGADVLSEEDLQNVISLCDTRFAEFHQTHGVAFAPARIEVSEGLDANEIYIEMDDVAMHRDALIKDKVAVRLSDAEQDKPDHATPIRLGTDFARTFWIDQASLGELPTDSHQIPLPELLADAVFQSYTRNLGVLFSMSDLQVLMAEFKATDPVGTDLICAGQSEIAIYEIMRLLIEEGVPLRPYGLFIDALAHWTRTLEAASPSQIADCMRGSMRRQYCRLLAGADNVLGVVLLDPSIEGAIRREINGQRNPAASFQGIPPGSELSHWILSGVRHFAGKKTEAQPVLVVSADVRLSIRSHLTLNDLSMPVLAANELSRDVRTIPIGRIVGKQRPVEQSKAEPVE